MTTVQELNDRAVAQLVANHQARIDEPLVLAVRFHPEGDDIHLLEVLADFPGPDSDELLHVSYEPSANLLFIGRLHLYLGSAGQVLAAARHRDEVIAAAAAGQVVYSDGSEVAEQLLRALRQ